jgi:hypothetical protein
MGSEQQLSVHVVFDNVNNNDQVTSRDVPAASSISWFLFFRKGDIRRKKPQDAGAAVGTIPLSI